jgi:hypothetical protein
MRHGPLAGCWRFWWLRRRCRTDWLCGTAGGQWVQQRGLLRLQHRGLHPVRLAPATPRGIPHGIAVPGLCLGGRGLVLGRQPLRLAPGALGAAAPRTAVAGAGTAGLGRSTPTAPEFPTASAASAGTTGMGRAVAIAAGLSAAAASPASAGAAADSTASSGAWSGPGSGAATGMGRAPRSPASRTTGSAPRCAPTAAPGGVTCTRTPAGTGRAHGQERSENRRHGLTATGIESRCREFPPAALQALYGRSGHDHLVESQPAPFAGSGIAGQRRVAGRLRGGAGGCRLRLHHLWLAATGTL